MSDIIEFDAADFGVEEEVQIQEENTERSENEAFYDEATGNSFSPDEMKFWKQLQEEGQYLVDNGRSEEEVLGLMNGCFRQTVERNDLREFIDTEKKHGYSKDDITPEMWEAYEKNIGKKTLKQIVEEHDPFIQSFFEDVKPANTRVSKRYSDPFLEGFNS